MSKIQVNEIVNHFDNGAPDCPKGLTVTGFTTFSGSVSIGGTLTYEDVTNVESIGVATFRDDVNIGVGGTVAFFDVSTGRIGIGTDSPNLQSTSANNLVIADFAGEGGITIKTNINSAGNIFFADTAATANGRIAYGHGTTDVGDYMRFYVANEEKLRIKANGYVGIGTNNPESNLHIHSPNNDLTKIRLSGTAANQVEYDIRQGIVGVENGGISIRDITNTVTRFAINSSGNIGIGTDNPNDTLEVLGSAIIGKSGAASQIRFRRPSEASITGFVGYTDSGNDAKFEFRGDGGAANVKLNANNATGYITFDTNSVEKVRIDSTGNVGIGLTNPSAKLEVYLGTNVAGTIARFGGYNDGRSLIFSNSGVGADHFINAQASGGSITFQTGSNDRVKIDSSGRLLVGTVTAPLYGSFQVYPPSANVATFVADSGYVPIFCWNKSTAGATFAEFGTGTSYNIRGSITYNSGTGQTNYNAVSDYRAKTILGKLNNSGELVDSLNVYRGIMKGATQERPMLIAHEAQAVAPYCVTGEKDAVDADGNPIYQQMDHQILVPLLIAEIQQLRARVAALEGA